jgi:iron complex outermembrane receptor protein
VLSIPEALRLAPNLQVEQLTASGYSITARGFGDSRDVQTQANKLLILVDGRTVYSPLFSGVFYDAIDVVMDDIDRIEVISGPGASLWGANAMNGVINIITRTAADTQGALLRFNAGNAARSAVARYGGKYGETLEYRVYGKVFDRDALDLASGASAEDDWQKRQGGFRMEWGRARDALTLQGDVFHADQSVAGQPDIANTGLNVLGRWEHTGEKSQLRVQTYYDRTEREAPADAAGFVLDTYDLEIQQSASLGTHQLVWGAGKRINNYHIMNGVGLRFIPSHRSLDLGNIFLQDTIGFGSSLNLTAGVKLEDSPYSGWSTLPDLRISWAPSDTTLLWGAVSRAIRAPTPFDTDVAEFFPTLILRGNPDFVSEKLWGYEVGYRGQPLAMVSLSASVFYDEYEDLRSVEFGPPGIPLQWGNQIEGHTYGVEAWANVQVRPWWRLSPGLRSLHKRLRFAPGASQILDVGQTGDDPSHQASLKSFMSFGSRVTFDAFLRHVGELPAPQNPDYYELSARLAWRLSDSLELGVSGFNLLHEHHTEYPVPTGERIQRSVFVEARVTF